MYYRDTAGSSNYLFIALFFKNKKLNNNIIII